MMGHKLNALVKNKQVNSAESQSLISGVDLLLKHQINDVQL
jgi:hypothetical protein